ncbi:Hpt domain-containing protein [Gemmatimonadota bacterium]
MSEEHPVLDAGAIERLEEWGGVALPRKMIGIFLEHSPERMDQVRDGLSGGDPSLAEAGAHSLKSSAGNVGAVQLQHLAEEAEVLAEEGRMEELRDLFPAMESAFEAVCEALRNTLEGMEE